MHLIALVIEILLIGIGEQMNLLSMILLGLMCLLICCLLLRLIVLLAFMGLLMLFSRMNVLELILRSIYAGLYAIFVIWGFALFLFDAKYVHHHLKT